MAQHPVWPRMSCDRDNLSPRENAPDPFEAFSGNRMTSPRGNRFEDFFADDAYVALKNFLYNYLLRKRAIEACLRGDERGLILEIGSGLSSTVAESGKVVYSELSFSALRTLKDRQRMG